MRVPLHLTLTSYGTTRSQVLHRWHLPRPILRLVRLLLLSVLVSLLLLYASNLYLKSSSYPSPASSLTITVDPLGSNCVTIYSDQTKSNVVWCRVLEDGKTVGARVTPTPPAIRVLSLGKRGEMR